LQRLLRDPRRTLQSERLRIDELAERARRALLASLRLARARLRGAGEQLQALSPMAVLERGYAIVRRADDGRVVQAAAQLAAGDALELTFRQGGARVRVETTRDD